ncbi:uncharacterized protein [Phyllobates terribilis]|uniref:uncharacterized protein n=1 Tax=Phyllobates terribilis TaxID=111132 RepID=UPI003CCA76DC
MQSCSQDWIFETYNVVCVRPEEHQNHVKTELEDLRTHHLYIKLEKCEFHQTEIQLLGYIISTQGLKMDSSKIQAITEWPTPKNMKEVLPIFTDFSLRIFQAWFRNGKVDALSRIFSKDPSTAVPPRTILPESNFLGVIHNKDLLEDIREAYETDPILLHPPDDISFTFQNNYGLISIASLFQ